MYLRVLATRTNLNLLQWNFNFVFLHFTCWVKGEFLMML